ncbi:glycosyltransferase family 25 protein [Aeromonas rivipollensis]|uniref:glycosyltransferase family 25 protein n=1 Tax=Aeromonas rivipollensis TaxID=948519 RepID=UPI0038DA6562
MKIRVISLATSIVRREKISRELSSLGLKFTFFDAVNGLEADINDYDNNKRMWEKGHELTKGEQGCFSSHRALWSECLQSGEPLLIMEDDIELSGEFKSILIELEGPAREFEYIRLGRGSYRSLPGIGAWLNILKIDDAHTVVKYMAGPSCAHAYIISPAAASKFLSASTTWFWPVDDFMDKEYLHQVNNYGVEPPLAWQSGADSDIGLREKPGSRSIIGRMRKEYYRAKERLLNSIYNYIFYIKNKK